METFLQNAENTISEKLLPAISITHTENQRLTSNFKKRKLFNSKVEHLKEDLSESEAYLQKRVPPAGLTRYPFRGII